METLSGDRQSKVWGANAQTSAIDSWEAGMPTGLVEVVWGQESSCSWVQHCLSSGSPSWRTPESAAATSWQMEGAAMTTIYLEELGVSQTGPASGSAIENQSENFWIGSKTGSPVAISTITAAGSEQSWSSAFITSTASASGPIETKLAAPSAASGATPAFQAFAAASNGVRKDLWLSVLVCLWSIATFYMVV